MAQIRYTISLKHEETKEELSEVLKKNNISMSDLIEYGVMRHLDKLVDETVKIKELVKADREYYRVKAYLEARGYDSSTLKKKSDATKTKKSSAKKPVEKLVEIRFDEKTSKQIDDTPTVEDEVALASKYHVKSSDGLTEVNTDEMYCNFNGVTHQLYEDRFDANKYYFKDTEGVYHHIDKASKKLID